MILRANKSRTLSPVLKTGQKKKKKPNKGKATVIFKWP